MPYLPEKLKPIPPACQAAPVPCRTGHFNETQDLAVLMDGKFIAHERWRVVPAALVAGFAIFMFLPKVEIVNLQLPPAFAEKPGISENNLNKLRPSKSE